MPLLRILSKEESGTGREKASPCTKESSGAPFPRTVERGSLAGTAHYGVEESCIIATSTFTRAAQGLPGSLRVRLIDGREEE